MDLLEQVVSLFTDPKPRELGNIPLKDLKSGDTFYLSDADEEWCWTIVKHLKDEAPGRHRVRCTCNGHEISPSSLTIGYRCRGKRYL